LSASSTQFDAMFYNPSATATYSTLHPIYLGCATLT